MAIRTLVALAAVPAMLAGAAMATAAPRPVAVTEASAAAAPVTWEIDATHSELTFRIRHLVSRVRGRFDTFKGTLVADPANLSGGRVEVEIATASINTNNERRDNHLRNSDFFDAENHPTITFRSTQVTVNGTNLRVAGNLTMRGVTRPVVLEGEVVTVTGQPGRRRAGFEATTTINRMDYGVSWNRAAEGGGLTLSDEVEIVLSIAAVERAAS